MRVGKITEAEVDVLKYLWHEGREIPSKEILDYFNQEENRGWKKQNLNNFLSRLLKRGLIKRISQDRRYLYAPLVSEQEFETCQAEHFLNSMYGGSLFNFVSALSGGEIISQNEADEIKKLLED